MKGTRKALAPQSSFVFHQGAASICADQPRRRFGRPVLAFLVLFSAGLVASAPPAQAVDTTCAGYEATIVGTDGNDVITGTDARDVIVGLDGDDTITGLTGDDHLCGQNGLDTLQGGLGMDTVRGGSGGDVLDPGNEAHDVIDYSNSMSAVSVDLSLGTATGQGTDTLVSWWQVNGTAFDDTMVGGATNDTFLALDGNDLLKGNGGDDWLGGGRGVDDLRGAWGADTLYGAQGNDLMIGGLGDSDIADYWSMASDDGLYYNSITVDLAAGTATGTGWGSDSLSEFEGVYGTGVSDWIAGSYLNDHLNGYVGDDIIYGRAGNDYLEAFLGNSELYGGADFDTCNGGVVRSSCEASP